MCFGEWCYKDEGVGKRCRNYQACGSGACATSVAASVLGLSSKNNKIILDGGNLYIKWLEDKTVTLTGMTERVFEGILEY